MYIYTHTCFAWFGHFFMPSKWSCFPLLEMATCEAWRHVFLLKWLCNPFWKTASLGFYKQVLQVIASVSMSMRLSIFTYSPIPLFPYFPISDLFTYLPIYQLSIYSTAIYNLIEFSLILSYWLTDARRLSKFIYPSINLRNSIKEPSTYLSIS